MYPQAVRPFNLEPYSIPVESSKSSFSRGDILNLLQATLENDITYLQCASLIRDRCLTKSDLPESAKHRVMHCVQLLEDIFNEGHSTSHAELLNAELIRELLNRIEWIVRTPVIERGALSV